jgi:hypothetical protein
MLAGPGRHDLRQRSVPTATFPTRSRPWRESAASLGENLFDLAELKIRKELRNIERDVTAKSGEYRSLLIHLKEVSIQGGTVLYCCRDITDRRHAEDEGGNWPMPRGSHCWASWPPPSGTRSISR